MLRGGHFRTKKLFENFQENSGKGSECLKSENFGYFAIVCFWKVFCPKMTPPEQSKIARGNSLTSVESAFPISKSRSNRSRSGLIKSDFSERCLLISLADAKRVVESNAFSNALSWSKRKGSRYIERSLCKNQSSIKVGSFLFSK